MVANLLQINNLSISFVNQQLQEAVAVDNLSLALAPSAVLCLVGESGSGKSLTALSILGLLPKSAKLSAASEVLFAGENILDFSITAMNRFRGLQVGIVFQEPMTSLNPVFKVGEQIMEPLMLHLGFSKVEARLECLKLLEQVGIKSPSLTINSYAHELSGGMRQRVMIAMAMSRKPKLLVADEPTTALDAKLRGQILDLMHSLCREYNSALLLITHDLDIATRITKNNQGRASSAVELAVMYAGQIIEQGPASELLAQPCHPYTAGLIKARPHLQVAPRGARLESIAGMVPSPFEKSAGCIFAPRCKLVFADCLVGRPQLTKSNNRFCRCFLAKQSC